MIEVIDTLEKLDAIKDVWQTLEKNPQMRVQQTFEWTRAGWLHFNSVEGDARLRIIKWQRDSQVGCVIFPFYIDRRGTLRFINDIHCDATNVVCGADGNHHYAFLEVIEWIMTNPEIKRIHLRQMPSGVEALNFFSVLIRGSIVYRDHGYSWLDVRKSQNVADALPHYKKKDRKKFSTLLKKAADYEYRRYLAGQGDDFPQDVFDRIRECMITSGRRTSQYLDDRLFAFAKDMFAKGIIEVASLSQNGEPHIAAFRLIKDNRRLCWIVLYDDAKLPTALHSRYMSDLAGERDFIYDFGVGPYGYKLVTFKPMTAPTFSLQMAKSPWGQMMAVKDLLVRYAKDYLKPIIRKEH